MIIKQLKKDMIVFSMVILFYVLVIKGLAFESHDFIGFTTKLIALVMCFAMNIIAIGKINKRELKIYQGIAIIYAFMQSCICIILIRDVILSDLNINPLTFYISASIYEVIGITALLSVWNKGINIDRVIKGICILGIIFLIMVIYIPDKVEYLISKELGKYIQCLLVIQCLFMIGNCCRDRYKYVQVSPLDINSMIFWIIKLVSHVCCIYYLDLCTSEMHILLYGARILLLYYLLRTLYCICLKCPWQELINACMEAEEKLGYNEKDRDMIVNLSHELKTPINVIQSAVQILQLDLVEDKGVIKDLASIKMDCNASMKIITYMIDIHKLKGGYIPVVFKKYNLVEVIENVVEAFVEETSSMQLVFNTNEEEISCRIDLALMQRCFITLIGLGYEKGQLNALVDIEKLEDKQGVKIKIDNKNVYEFCKYLNEEVKANDEGQIGEILVAEVIKEILNIHKVSIKREEKQAVCFYFEEVEDKEEEILLAQKENVNVLREQLRNYYIVS